MLGLSDTTLGALTSVLLHAGVVAAFFGPLGDGRGDGEQVVLVSIDGVATTSEAELGAASPSPGRDRVPAVRDIQQPQSSLVKEGAYPAPRGSAHARRYEESSQREGAQPAPSPGRDRVPAARDIQQPQSSLITEEPSRPVIPGGGANRSPQEQHRAAQGGGGLLGSLFAQPRLISLPKPAYPPTARARGVEGKVGIRVSITAQGSVDRADVVRSSGVESFDTAARESALQARFQPALQGGVPAPAEKTIVVTFSLLE